MKIVDEILRNRDLEALINEKDYDGNTPLHLAAMYGRSEIVQALVSDKRVDKRIVNNEKLKPSGVVAKLLQGGRFEAPKSDGMVCLYADILAKNENEKATFNITKIDCKKIHSNSVSNVYLEINTVFACPCSEQANRYQA